MIALLAASAWARPHLSHVPGPVAPAIEEPVEVAEDEVPPAPTAATTPTATPTAAATPIPMAVEPSPTPTDPLYDDLLGGVAPSAASATFPAAPSFANLWPLVVAIGGAGAVYLATRKRAGRGTDLVRVVSRSVIGAGQAGLVVVDVKDPSGRTRRLLVGTGGTGAPTLVADLGEDGGDEVDVDVEVETPAPRARPSISLYQAPIPQEPRPILAGARQKAQAMALIGEIVQARRASGE